MVAKSAPHKNQTGHAHHFAAWVLRPEARAQQH